jgi:hypothetical protein
MIECLQKGVDRVVPNLMIAFGAIAFEVIAFATKTKLTPFS